MPIVRIPEENKKWTQPNDGDLSGILYGTFNMDLNLKKGKATLSPRLRVRTDSDDDADLQKPTAAVRDEGYTTLTFNDSESVTAQETDPISVFFRQDGLKMYILGQTGNDVNEYNLSSAWDVTSATFVQNFATGFTTPKGLFFKHDGLKMYVQQTNTDTIQEYNLSTAWNISTAVAGGSISTAGQDANGGQIFFRPNGLTVYMLGDANTDVFQYTLSTAWDITTAVFLQSFSVTAQDAGMDGITFKSDGLTMYTSGGSNDKIYEYYLTTPWDISTATFVQGFSISANDNDPNGLFMKLDDNQIFMVGGQNDSVYNYTLGKDVRWWVLANNAIFKSNDETVSGFTQEAPTIPLTNIDHITSDLAIHERKVWASSRTGLNYTFGDSWTLLTPGGNFLTDDVPHPLHVFNRLLLVGNNNLVHQVDRNGFLIESRIIFPPIYQIRCIRSTPGRIWFAMKNLVGGKAAVGEWDGFSDTFLNIHEIEGNIAFALGVKDGVPYTISSAGILFKHNGSTFAPEAYLPVFSEDMYQISPSSRVRALWEDVSTYQFLVSANGMEVIDDQLHIQLSGAISGANNQIFENMPSGIWCYDPDIGLYHRYSFSKYKTTDTVKDYGTSIIERTGFLVKLPNELDGLFLTGATILTIASGTPLHIIATKDDTEAFTTPKRGNFITTQIHTSDVQETWDKLWAKYRKFRDSNTKIAFKIRSGLDDNFNFPFDATITWVSGTSFTSTDVNFANVVAGNEIFVSSGDGAGATAHVVTNTLLTGTYTIILDETVGTVGAATTSRVKVNNWRRFKTLDSSLTTTTNDDMALNETSNWIQFKVELRGIKDDPELHEMIISTKGNIKGTV